jgi:hypothetical protein
MPKFSPVASAALRATSNRPFSGRDAPATRDFGSALAVIAYEEPAITAKAALSKVGAALSSFSRDPAIIGARDARGVGDHSRFGRGNVGRVPGSIETAGLKRSSSAVLQGSALDAGPDPAHGRAVSSVFQSTVVPALAGVNGLTHSGDAPAIPIPAQQRIQLGTETSQSDNHSTPDLPPGSGVVSVGTDPTLPLGSSVLTQSAFGDGSGLSSMPPDDAALGLVENPPASSKAIAQPLTVSAASVARPDTSSSVQQVSPGFDMDALSIVGLTGLPKAQLMQAGSVRRSPGLAPAGGGLEGVTPAKSTGRVALASSAAGPVGIIAEPSQALSPMAGVSDAVTDRIAPDPFDTKRLVNAIGFALASESSDATAATAQSPVGHSGSGHAAPEAGQGVRYQELHGHAGDLQAGDVQLGTGQAVADIAASVGGASVSRPPSASVTLPLAVREQVAAAAAMAQGRSVNGQFSVSITADGLGQISITVERGTDGTTIIHVAAEHLATLDMLRTDQRDLMRALDKSGLGPDQHSLYFSWDGGSASGWTGQGWRARDDGHGEPPPVDPAHFYAREPVAVPMLTLLTRPGVDVTA